MKHRKKRRKPLELAAAACASVTHVVMAYPTDKFAVDTICSEKMIPE